MNSVLSKKLQMKPSGSKNESKKRKRDDSKDGLPDGSKKAKVHAQRKFAQGAAFNSPGITPIKDRARPPPAAPASGPLLAGKCPNTEDFLTFLCFRRTSILPPRLNFFNLAPETEVEPSTPPKKSSPSTGSKSTVENAGKQSKKVEKKDESKKSHTHTVQALKKKYQEQRLAKQRGTNVTKLAKKVKGKNMMKTRSSGAVEKNESKKPSVVDKKNLQTNIKKTRNIDVNVTKRVDSKRLRSGLRSDGSSNKFSNKSDLSAKSLVLKEKRAEKSKKRTKSAVTEIKAVNSKAKKIEGFSDFSSDDNEPLLMVRKPKVGSKTPKPSKESPANEKGNRKSLMKSKSETAESESSNVTSRPTRKTKEAAAIYMEMITKKLVSPEKNDDDVSSVDSFPELPNAKRNEQRESEIKAKAMASKSVETKVRGDDKNVQSSKKAPSKRSSSGEKAEAVLIKSNRKKETKDMLKAEDRASTSKKELSKEESPPKGYRKRFHSEPKKVVEELNLTRPSTRSKLQEEQVSPKKNKGQTNNASKLDKKTTEKPKDKVFKKSKKEKPLSKVNTVEKESDPVVLESNSGKEVAITRKRVQRMQEKSKEDASTNEKQINVSKSKTIEKKEMTAVGKLNEKKSDSKKIMGNGKKKQSKKSEKEESDLPNQRPTRKCSTVDKIWIDMDEFTSDEDEYVNMLQLSKDRISSKGQNLKGKGRSGKSVDTDLASEKKSKNCSESNEKVDKRKRKTENFMEEQEQDTQEQKSRSKIKTQNNVKSTQVKREEKEGSKASKGSEPIKEKKLKATKGDKNVKESFEKKKECTSPVAKTKEPDVSGPSTSEDKKDSISNSFPSKKTIEEGKLSSRIDREEQVADRVFREKNMLGEDTNDAKNVTEPKKKRNKPMNTKKDNLRKRANSEEVWDSKKEENTKNVRKRPVRQCSTREKRWIETDSDSFSFYESSDDDDDIPKFDISKNTEKHEVDLGSESKGETSLKEDNAEPAQTNRNEKLEGFRSDNFSESDEEPLKKKSLLKEVEIPKSPETKPEFVPKPQKQEIILGHKAQREMPGLHPLKRNPHEGNPHAKGSDAPLRDFQISNPIQDSPEPTLSVPAIQIPNDSRTFFGDRKSDGPATWQSPKRNIDVPLSERVFEVDKKSSPVSPVPNRVEVMLHSLKRDKPQEKSNPFPGEVKVTFEKVPCQPAPVPHGLAQVSCGPLGYTLNSVTFPPPREPISTHGLDLLSEVALPTTPKEKLTSQTERIEKWLKDSLAVEQKKHFPSYQESGCKETQGKREEEVQMEVPAKRDSYFEEKSVPVAANVGPSSHFEPKFGQFELLESQKLLKRNLFCGEVKQEPLRIEQPMPMPKKALTSVQDLLKLQKERKETVKASAGNSPHLKNCKCNSCVVKKGWFKNKPLPKAQVQKSVSLDDGEGSSKPFESLTKAFTKFSKEEKNSKISASVAPIVTDSSFVPDSATPSCSKEKNEKKGIFQQRKLSFLERMKEREKKEASAKQNPRAFSPSNESSVYAFEPEPEQVQKVSTPFRSKLRESRTSSASRSDEEGLRICEDEESISGSIPGQSVKTETEHKGLAKASQSASIAVQVNLDSETTDEAEPETEPHGQVQDGKSIEISTQTEVPEEDSDSPMFYIPLQTKSAGPSISSSQQLIQGVALKLGTEGPMGPNQRVIMKAKLVTKAPDSSSVKAIVMPQPKRLFDQKNNNPPVGTVQPTTRRPREALPEDSGSNKSTNTGPQLPATSPSSPVNQDAPSEPAAPSDSSPESKVSRNSSGASGVKPSNKRKEKISGSTKTEASREHSPSSSSSTSKPKKPGKQKSSDTKGGPSHNPSLPSHNSSSKLLEAPTFHPTEKDFQDPFEYFERIRPAAEKFGLCRIVPPATFKPDCKVSDDMRFTAYNQYVHRMFHRWGPNIKEMMAIKKYLMTQSISLKQPPWIGGIEVDLPRLYQSVQQCGGLMKVMEKKKWNQVADMMKIPKAAQDRVTKLDDIYCKYLLPYDTLSHDERQKLFDEVEKDWEQRQSVPVESQSEEESEEENYIEECEECVVKGRNMALNQFYRIARNTMSMWFRNPEPPPREVENEFWKHVRERNHHVCVHSGSIDSSGWGYGFPVAKNNSFSKHPWNLKILTNNPGSVLRSLGPVMGVTVPTLHVGMVFAAFCWYRDPHGLPWIEYLHTGAPKIWYGISDDNSAAFREALFKLLPRYTKKKTVWLPSDTAMIPPDLLAEQGVSLCHIVQEPGQFILVFPRAFTSSICTGYLVSESVYFAQPSWLTTAEQVFKDIQESCEPSMFSLEKLLFSIATDSRSSVEVLKQVLPMVWHLKQKEMDERKTLSNLGLKSSERLPAKECGSKRKKGRWTQEDDGDYECEVCRKNLYVSLVINSQEEGVYCLPHAADLLTRKRHHLKHCKLMYIYTQEEMNEMIEKLEQRIESKSQKKVQSKSAATAK